MTKDSRILTEEELRSIAENHRKLSVALPAPSVNQSLVWSALHDIPKLLAHVEALQTDVARLNNVITFVKQEIASEMDFVWKRDNTDAYEAFEYVLRQFEIVEEALQ